MNKMELIDAITNKTGLSKKDVNNTLTELLSTITSALAAEEKVTLVGFGTFATTKRKERKGRNPQTGKEITIAARTLPVFKAGKQLKDQMR